MSVPTVETALTDAHNIAVLGSTQTGKTSFVRELHATTPRDVSIWVNERGDERETGIHGVEARDLEDVRDAIARRESHIEFLPADRQAAMPGLRSLLWQVSDATDRALALQVTIDEADRVAPETQSKDVPHRDAVRMFTGEGVKRNIKTITITQHPQGIDKESLRNSRYRAVWAMSSEAQASVSKYGFDWGEVRDAPMWAGVLHYMTGDVLGTVKAAEEYAT